MTHPAAAVDAESAAYVARYVEDWKAHAEPRTRGRDVLAREHRAVQACIDAGCVSVLDVGCNEGYFSIAAHRRGLVATLMDVARPIVDFARSNMIRAGENPYATVVGMAEALGSEFGRWDGAVCMEVVEHVRFPALVVRKLRERARRVVVLTTPLGNCYDDPLHIHHWADEDALAAALDLSSFRSFTVERIPSKDGDSERVFFVVGTV